MQACISKQQEPFTHSKRVHIYSIYIYIYISMYESPISPIDVAHVVG